MKTTVCKKSRCTNAGNIKGKNTENADKHNKGISSSIQGRIVMHRRQKCGKKVGRVVGEEENMRRVERSVSGRSESSSGEVEEEVEGG